MPAVLALCEWLYQLPLSTALRESEVAYPVVETIHVLSVTLVAGAILFADLRILGLTLRSAPVSQVIGRIVPLAWSGFAIMAVTGSLLFMAEAAKLYGNVAFQAKLALLALAGANQAIFHGAAYRSVHQWDLGPAPAAAQAGAAASIALWTGVIVSGRLIAYLHVH